MKIAVLTTLAAIAAASMLGSSPTYAVGGSCRPRALAAEEQRAGERVAAGVRPLLPSAPPGWQVEGSDKTDIASGSCLDGGKSVPQPVTVQVTRTFARVGPPPAAPTANVASPARASVPDPQLRERARALEQQIRDLQREEAAATAAYQAARRAGDSAGQRAAVARGRELRVAKEAPLTELRQIQAAERQQREAYNAAQREAGVAQTKAMLANRRLAHVSINTNSGRALARASSVASIPGVPLAIVQPGFSTNLLFGSGWIHTRHEAHRPWAFLTPTTRVQDVNVAVDGNDEVMQALIARLDFKALDALIER